MFVKIFVLRQSEYGGQREGKISLAVGFGSAQPQVNYFSAISFE
jgi:hypothetical protein